MFIFSNSSSLILIPVGYIFSSRCAFTVNPVFVVVPAVSLIG
jgi:hypothetical protein